MKSVPAVLALVISAALVPLAADWRSPFLAAIRPAAFFGLIVGSLSMIVVEAWILRTCQAGQRTLRAIGIAGMVAAAVVLTATLSLETRFHWVRHRVLHADPDRLERLGRHLIVGYRNLDEARELVKLRAIGGIFLSGRNVRGKSVAQVRREIRSLQSMRKEQGLRPLWIATDQEGGFVSRVSPPLRRLPPLSEIVKRHSDEGRQRHAVRQFAASQARGLTALGVNLNFAPVVDINHQVTNPNDRFTRIRDRAISKDPKVVAQVADWYCAALEEAGVQCTLKHFPGLGRVFEDTHLSCANLATPVSELAQTDWVPFRALMREGKAFTMLGHVQLTAIDSDRPVSVAPSVIAGLLRGNWSYDGVLITDDFSMYALYRSSSGMDHGSVDALNAGLDLILVSWDCDQYYRVMSDLLEADERGKLNREVLHRSDRRLARAMRNIRN